MSGQPIVYGFLDAYRAAFESLDVSAIEGLFSYPCLITSDADRIEVTVVHAREDWLPQLEWLVTAYRAIGVRSAEPLDVRVAVLSSRLVQATVRWRLGGQDGAPLYDFVASYTLADLGAGLRITAIAHDEASQLRALVSAARPSWANR